MVRRRTLSLVLSIVALAGLSACSGEQPGFADLEGDPVGAQSVPDAVVESLGQSGSADYRWIGEHGGADLWIAPGLTDDDVCIVAYRADDEWLQSCGVSGDGTPLTVSGYGTYYVVRDGQAVPEGATAVSSNVFAG